MAIIGTELDYVENEIGIFVSYNKRKRIRVQKPKLEGQMRMWIKLSYMMMIPFSLFFGLRYLCFLLND